MNNHLTCVAAASLGSALLIIAFLPKFWHDFGPKVHASCLRLIIVLHLVALGGGVASRRPSGMIVAALSVGSMLWAAINALRSKARFEAKIAELIKADEEAIINHG